MEDFNYKVDDFVISESQLRKMFPPSVDAVAFMQSLGFKVRIENDEIVALDPIESIYDISSMHPKPINGWGFDGGYRTAYYWGSRGQSKTATAEFMQRGFKTSISYFDEALFNKLDTVDVSYFDVPRDIRYSEADGNDAKAELEALGWPVPLRHRIERGIY